MISDHEEGGGGDGLGGARRWARGYQPGPGKSATCTCKGGTTFAVANGSSGVPSASDIQEIMFAKCGACGFPKQYGK